MYSFSLTTFSPSGKLVQIEYALARVAAGGTSLAIKGIFFLGGFFSFWKRTFCIIFLLSLLLLQIWVLISFRFSAKNGVVLATEKKLPILIDESSVQKCSMLTENIGLVYSGMGPDTRVLVRKGRKKAQKYFRTYREPISTDQLVKELASIMQEFTQSG